MKTYFIFSNGVFIDRITNPLSPTDYLQGLVITRGYRLEDLEMYEYDEAEVNSMLSQQDNGKKLSISVSGLELSNYVDVVEEHSYFKPDPDPTKPDIKVTANSFRLEKQIISYLVGTKV